MKKNGFFFFLIINYNYYWRLGRSGKYVNAMRISRKTSSCVSVNVHTGKTQNLKKGTFMWLNTVFNIIEQPRKKTKIRVQHCLMLLMIHLFIHILSFSWCFHCMSSEFTSLWMRVDIGDLRTKDNLTYITPGRALFPHNNWIIIFI